MPSTAPFFLEALQDDSRSGNGPAPWATGALGDLFTWKALSFGVFWAHMLMYLSC